ncbi:MAG TPA: UV DNA damage repair endonuclease UvsE [Elusimicrobia bacterium]|nr:UV DNA damage repair endonuclease UvsE [Elusimicrobiota bacterium]
MRIGYPCINRSIGCTANSRFRLASYTPARLKETLARNLACLERILHFNAENDLRFFRVSSDLVPFASHPVCRVDWGRLFRREFARLGRFIRSEGFRVSMHPDQFVLLNALEEGIVERSVAELEYHARVLELLGLDRTAKIQIHVGGVYGERPAAMERFVRRYEGLPRFVRRRLVIENDDRLYPLADCLELHRRTGVPVLFDSFHHALLNRGESLSAALRSAAATWKPADGRAMMDYSSQERGRRAGAHAESLSLADFRRFLQAARRHDPDVMLEIKDKEASALKALDLL